MYYYTPEPNYDAMWEDYCAAHDQALHDGYRDGWHGKLNHADEYFSDFTSDYHSTYQLGQQDRKDGNRFLFSWGRTPDLDITEFAVWQAEDDIPF